MLALAGLLALASPASAAGVVGGGTPSSCTEAALDAAVAGGGSVTFNCGPGPTTLTLTKAVSIDGATSIDGGNGQVALAGGGTSGSRQPLFAVSATGNLSLANLTLRDAFNYATNGAIYNVGTLSVSNVRFINNGAQMGGAIYNDGHASHLANVFIRDSVFSGNFATAGPGGAIITFYGHITIIDSVFSNNQASGGGAIYSWGDLTVDHVNFSNNAAVQYNNGGALELIAANTTTINNSVFANNTANLGGAIDVTGAGVVHISNTTFTGNDGGGQAGALQVGQGTVDVVNSTLTGNSARHAGAAANSGGHLAFSNSTIANNSASIDGGGIENYYPDNSPLYLFNSIVANNHLGATGPSQNCSPTTSTVGAPLGIASLGHNLDTDGTCQLAGPGDLSRVDPQLGPLQDNGGFTPTMALGAGSPAVDAGGPTTPEPVLGFACLPADQRDFRRPAGAACDIGAYEFQAGLPTVTLTVAIAGTGTGSVTSSPIGLMCPPIPSATAPRAVAPATSTTCSAQFAAGTAVTLTATPTGASFFGGWSGGCGGSGACLLTISGDQTVTATFSVPPIHVLPQPQRVVDTRSSGGAIPTGDFRCFQLAGAGGIPVDAGAVVLNVAAVGHAVAGWLTVYPMGQAVPATSALNFDPSEYAIANGALVRLGTNGAVCVTVGTVGSVPGGAQVVLDVTGYIGVDGLDQLPMLDAPQRLVDTRQSGGPITSGTSRCFTIAGLGGIPADAAAVVLNVTAVGQTGPGWLAVYPNGQAVPATSTLNFDRTEYAIANNTVMRIDSGGQVCVEVGTVNGAPGSAHAVLDATGYLASSALGQVAMLTAPLRLVDTRVGGSPIASGATHCFPVAGVQGIPSDAAGVVVNVTAVGYGTPGWLTVYPAGQRVPATSTLNFDRTEYAMANGAILAVGTNGEVCVGVGTVNSTPGSAQVVLDVTGYLGGAPVQPSRRR